MTTDLAGPTGQQRDRWAVVLANLSSALPHDSGPVVVDGTDWRATLLAERLADALRRAGHARRTVVPADDARDDGSDPGVRIWVRGPSHSSGDRYRGDGADIVVDLHDPAWPVIRHLDRRLAAHDAWYRSETRAFFAPRAATWDTKFGDDAPAYAAAIAEAAIPAGGVAIDVGCGTGRAFAALRYAVGPAGVVVGVDLTPQMLAVARTPATASRASLVLADARRLPLADRAADAVFAAGLVTHLPDAVAGLHELARVTRSGGRLVLFHPSGRAALAARHGRTLRPDEPLAEVPLRRATERAGWCLTSYDDAQHRFLAVATRR